jgi:hypothetical protein
MATPRMDPRCAVVMALLVWSLAAGAQGVDSGLAGMVKRVSGTVTLERAGVSSPVRPGTLLRVGDRITTSSPGGVGIVLADDTLVTAGPGSKVEVGDLKFDSTTHEGNIFIRLFKGALHFVTGLIGKQKPENVKIETPTAVMGVRGTEFIVETAGAKE